MLPFILKNKTLFKLLIYFFLKYCISVHLSCKRDENCFEVKDNLEYRPEIDFGSDNFVLNCFICIERS